MTLTITPLRDIVAEVSREQETAIVARSLETALIEARNLDVGEYFHVTLDISDYPGYPLGEAKAKFHTNLHEKAPEVGLVLVGSHERYVFQVHAKLQLPVGS